MRKFLKVPSVPVLSVWLASLILCAVRPVFAQTNIYSLEAPVSGAGQPEPINMSGMSPSGDTLAVNQRYFTRNGKPWYPLMGEIHYERYPYQYWEEEIIKMKSAGLSVIATYTFWNAHENPQGDWNWKDNLDLGKFIRLCQKHGLYVWLRIGPYCNGEQLYGGFPEWISRMKGKRSNDPAYLKEVTALYGQIGKQTQGLFFKDGGPIIGVQVENEYANGQPEHISMLKQIALDAGIRPVFFSITANTVFYDNKFEVLPLQGAYPYRGWEKGGGGATKDFLYGNDQWIMTDALGKVFYDVNKYPKGLCEQGCGSQMTFENRFVVDPRVEEAHLQNQVGRGMNLVGYYMFNGGTQRPGLKAREGLPESYDFQAPVSEFGFLRESYKYLKILHHFLTDFGSELAQMRVVEPPFKVMNENNTDSLRYIGRFNGDRGFVFLNNTQVRIPMPDKKFRLRIALPGETLTFPRNAITLKGETSAILPVNLSTGGVLIKYATAQPLARFINRGREYLFFTRVRGMAVELMLEKKTIRNIHATGWKIEKDREKIYLCDPAQGMPACGINTIDLVSGEGKQVTIIVLTRKQAENSWRLEVKDNPYLLLSDADLMVTKEAMEFRQTDGPDIKFSIYPALRSPVKLSVTGPPEVKLPLVEETGRSAGLSSSYRVRLAKADAVVQVSRIRPDSVSIMVPAVLPDQASDMILNITYRGSGAEARMNGQLMTDDLYNGETWKVGLKRYMQEGGNHGETGSSREAGKTQEAGGSGSAGETLEFRVSPWNDRITGIGGRNLQLIKAGPSQLSIKAALQYRVVLKVN